MFANPAIAQLFENPEILEQSRQQILGNPMLMQAYDSMGMGGLIRDPDAFRQQVSPLTYPVVRTGRLPPAGSTPYLPRDTNRTPSASR